MFAVLSLDEKVFILFLDAGDCADYEQVNSEGAEFLTCWELHILFSQGNDAWIFAWKVAKSAIIYKNIG